MPKKPKQIETHGKVETPETKPTTLEQIWGYNALGRYGTTDAAVYAEKLKDMNRADLESEARKYGVVVVEDSRRLIGNLQRAFEGFVSSLNKPVNKIQPSSISDEARKILAEGR